MQLGVTDFKQFIGTRSAVLFGQYVKLNSKPSAVPGAKVCTGLSKNNGRTVMSPTDFMDSCPVV